MKITNIFMIKQLEIDRCIDKYKKLYGLKPYDKGYNPCYQDGYFAKSIKEDFCEDVRKEAYKEIVKLMESE